MEDLKEPVISQETIAPSQGQSLPQESVSAPPEIPQESVSKESSPVVEPVSHSEEVSSSEEKMVPQSKVNSVVGPLNKKVKETELRLSQLQRQHEDLTNRLKGIQDPGSPDAIKTLARSEVVSAQYEQEMSQMYVESEFHIKESENHFRSIHPDYDDSVRSVAADFQRLNQINPQLTLMISQTKNPASVVYQLSKDPEKFGQFATLVGSGYKQSAQAFLDKLESQGQAPASMKNQPTITKAPPKPLSQVIPSPKAVGEGSSDFVQSGNVVINHSRFKF